MRSVSTPCGLNPGSTFIIRQKLFARMLAPTTRTKANAISKTTSAARRVPFDPDFMAALVSARRA